MKSLLNKLIFLVVILAGWVVYDRWDQITGSVQNATNTVSNAIKLDKADKPVTTTVYKWQDADGNWQFSNTKPASVPDAEAKQFRSDENVLPSVRAPAKPKSTGNNTKPDKKDVSSIPGAGFVQSVSKTFSEVQDLKKNLETPKTVPKE